MPPTSLRILGTPEVVNGSERTPLRATAPHALLAYLAVADRWVARHELAYLFRPDDPDGEALQYVRLQLHRAQRLDWVEGLEATAERVRWSVDSDLARLRRALDGGDGPAALDLYSGALLSGFALRGRPTFDTWLEVERAQLEERFRTLLSHWGDELGRDGDWERSLAVAERRLEVDPYDEDAVRALLRGLTALGRPSTARRRFDRFAASLSEGLGIEPDPATLRLVATLHDPAPPSEGGVAPRPTALPRAGTRFVGRARELAELARLLADPGCRLLTVVGLGGSGKTRLAVEAARSRAVALRDGAHFVAGAEVATHAQLLTRVASAARVELDGARDAGAALVEALSEREMLLLLDNLEHLPEAPRWVAALLDGAPNVQVLATSRAPLRLHAEWSYDVSGLALPGGDRTDGDAVDLFVAAAARAAPRLRLDGGALPHVVRICRRVAGLPLALELAAAWVRAMPVAAIADALDADTAGRGVALLETDRVDMPERHRSLTTILTRSWLDLTDAQREALLRLVPFVGGCTLATAETVTGVPATLWLSLLHRSLLERRDGGRFAPHPLVEEYATARLAEQPELEAAARDAHADHFIAELERAVGPGSAGLLALDPDAADLERAWRRLFARGDLTAALRATPAFFERYDVRGAFRAGLDVGRATLTWLPEPEAGVAAELRCALLLALATLAWEAGDYEPARADAEAALALALRFEVAAAAAQAHRRLGDVRQSTGDFEGAAAAYERAESAFERLADERGLANVLNSWASMDAVRERHADAEGRFRRCIALFERLGAVKDSAIARTNLGFVTEAQGALAAAAEHYEAGLAVFERIGFVRGQAAVQNNLVVLYGKQGRFDEAEAMGRASLAAKGAIGDALATVITLKNLGDLSLMQDDPERALERYLPAARTALEHGAVPRLLQVLVGAADALARSGDGGRAARLARAVAGHPSAAASLVERARELLGSLDDDRDGAPQGSEGAIERVAAEVLAEL